MIAQHIRRMPYGFGPMPGPRQASDGGAYSPADLSLINRVGLAVSFRTDGDLLLRLLPPGFSLREPVVTVEATSLTRLSWLAGRGYNTLGVSFPADYQGEQDAASGQFLSVLWENLADPIISGREELGYAKLYAELPPMRWTEAGVHSSASWDGFRFLELSATDLTPAAIPAAGPAPVLHYKYVPETGDLGQPAVAHACLTPDTASGRRTTSLSTGTGSIKFNRATFEELPTLHTVVNALAALPVLEIIGARVSEGSGGPDLSDQRRLR